MGILEGSNSKELLGTEIKFLSWKKIDTGGGTETGLTTYDPD